MLYPMAQFFFAPLASVRPVGIAEDVADTGSLAGKESSSPFCSCSSAETAVCLDCSFSRETTAGETLSEFLRLISLLLFASQKEHLAGGMVPHRIFQVSDGTLKKRLRLL
jgi:hypothetical protein